MKLFLPDEAAQEAFGARLAAAMPGAGGLVIYLEGNLGAGKTTLVRGFLHGCGHRGHVRSPTYTLIEPYDIAGRCIAHLDLYRLGDPEELEFLGLRDLLGESCIMLVEWPEKGRGVLPPADLRLGLTFPGSGRGLALEAASQAGEAILEMLDTSS